MLPCLQPAHSRRALARVAHSSPRPTVGLPSLPCCSARLQLGTPWPAADSAARTSCATSALLVGGCALAPAAGCAPPVDGHAAGVLTCAHRLVLAATHTAPPSAHPSGLQTAPAPSAPISYMSWCLSMLSTSTQQGRAARCAQYTLCRLVVPFVPGCSLPAATPFCLTSRSAFLPYHPCSSAVHDGGRP